MMQYLFDCAICEREISDYPRNGRDRHIAPICRICENHYGETAPNAGAFMDRRLTVQISALANALRGHASCIQFEARYGRSRL